MGDFSSSLKELFLSNLFKQYPEWEELAVSGKDEKRNDYVLIEITAPAATNSIHSLKIVVEEHIVTVGLDYWHQQFAKWMNDQTTQAVTADALEVIKEILEDRIVVVSWWHDDLWCGSEVIDAGQMPRFALSTDHQPNRVRTRSWSGLYNSEESL